MPKKNVCQCPSDSPIECGVCAGVLFVTTEACRFQETVKQLAEWLTGDETGSSSEAMAYCVLGVRLTDLPSDADDLHRCVKLVESVPAIREYFEEIATLSQQWGILIKHWNELERMYQPPVRSYEDITDRLKELI